VNRPTVEVADIFRAQGKRFIDRHGNRMRFQQLKVMQAIVRCRTAALGGHVDMCPRCGKDWGLSFNSCRNRHCPKCQAQARQRWIAARERELLAASYFHVVFSLPHELTDLIRQNEVELYNLLFRTVAETLIEVAANPKHLDGLKDGFAQKRLRLAGPIQHLTRPNCFAAFVRKLHRHPWVVYVKPPFGGPQQVLRYLGRYTHRVAISNHRLVAFDGDNVTFRWRDYAHGNVQRMMTVSAEEFIRRFLLHVLPKSFVRIRHFGFMANYQRSTSFELCRRMLQMAPDLPSPETGSAPSARLCPTCQTPLTVVERLTAVQIAWRFVSKCYVDTS